MSAVADLGDSVRLESRDSAATAQAVTTDGVLRLFRLRFSSQSRFIERRLLPKQEGELLAVRLGGIKALAQREVSQRFAVYQQLAQVTHALPARALAAQIGAQTPPQRLHRLGGPGLLEQVRPLPVRQPDHHDAAHTARPPIRDSDCLKATAPPQGNRTRPQRNG